jgi:hypothetical protein
MLLVTEHDFLGTPCDIGGFLERKVKLYVIFFLFKYEESGSWSYPVLEHYNVAALFYIHLICRRILFRVFMDLWP